MKLEPESSKARTLDAIVQQNGLESSDKARDAPPVLVECDTKGPQSEYMGLPIFRLMKDGNLVAVEVSESDRPFLEPIQYGHADGIEHQVGWFIQEARYSFERAVGNVHQRNELVYWCTGAIGRVSRAAHTRKIENLLNHRDLVEIVNRSGGYCEVTGLPFKIGRCIDFSRNPFAPSIDRIDSSGPYSLNNCRLVLNCVNVALNEWGDEVFDLIARAYVVRKSLLAHSGAPRPSPATRQRGGGHA